MTSCRIGRGSQRAVPAAAVAAQATDDLGELEAGRPAAQQMARPVRALTPDRVALDDGDPQAALGRRPGAALTRGASAERP